MSGVYQVTVTTRPANLPSSDGWSNGDVSAYSSVLSSPIYSVRTLQGEKGLVMQLDMFWTATFLLIVYCQLLMMAFFKEIGINKFLNNTVGRGIKATLLAVHGNYFNC